MAKDEVEGEVVRETEEKDETALAVKESATLIALERAQIDTQIATAKAYPRSVEEFKQACLTMATLDEDTAASMYYSVPRDGKVIQGESVRLAEIAGSAWGNTRYGARVVEVGEEFITARGGCFDLERNVAIEIDVKRRIVNKHGRRFSTDMIQTTGMAACSVALRNAIFKIVPRAYIKPVLLKCMAVAAGDAKTLEAKRTAALDYFEKKGIEKKRVFAFLDVKGRADVTTEHIVALLGVKTALSDGEAKLEDFFPAEKPPEETPVVSGAAVKGAKVSEQPQAKGAKGAKKQTAKKSTRAEEAAAIFD